MYTVLHILGWKPWKSTKLEPDFHGDETKKMNFELKIGELRYVWTNLGKFWTVSNKLEQIFLIS